MVPVAALAAGAALALSGCGAGQISQTASQVSAINGNTANIGKIALRNVHIVYPAVAGPDYTNVKGGKALIALSIVNNSESVGDELISVKTDLGEVKLTPPAGKSGVEIEPQHTLVAASKAMAHTAPATTPAAPSTTPHSAASEKPADDPAANPALIEITGLTRDITPGLTYQVTFNFKQNGTVNVQVPVDAGPLSARQGDTSDKAAAETGEHKSGH
ncbi:MULTISPECIES: hypothetical protein [unclassified Nocardia]|uniref:hypothetical protein n=1 Tax=unclassified Nocardia TaxID=2637762 RepID=UPI001CE454CD|nr:MULTISPECIES: hypothetical protein [unclassified Nocardia]